LARLELNPDEEEKLLADLGNILEHFKELQELDTTNVAPMTAAPTSRICFAKIPNAKTPTAARAPRRSPNQKMDT